MTTGVQPPSRGHGDDSDLDKAVHHLREAEHDLSEARAAEEEARADERRALNEIEEAAREVERAERLKEDHWIVVNGDRCVVRGDRVTFEEIIKIAYPVPPQGVDVQFTVQFTRGPESRPTGTLIEGQSAKIRDGMEFDVTPTNRS